MDNDVPDMIRRGDPSEQYENKRRMWLVHINHDTLAQEKKDGGGLQFSNSRSMKLLACRRPWYGLGEMFTS